MFKNQKNKFMRTALLGFIVLLILTGSCCQAYKEHIEILDLSGIWNFQLDPDNVGIEGKWFNKQLSDSIRLPGTTDENKKGILLGREKFQASS